MRNLAVLNLVGIPSLKLFKFPKIEKPFLIGAIVQIRDVVGKLVSQELRGTNVNGLITIEVNQKDLPRGFYTMNYQIGTERGTVKFVVSQ